MRALATLVVVALCVAPHVVRLLGDHAAYVDGIYAHGAWMMSEGFAPYVDFTHVALLPADLVLAGAMRAFGSDERVLELATMLVIFATGGLLALAARRAFGGLASAMAALVWCSSTWVLHFHLFERETWAALGVAWAFAAYARHVGEGAENVSWRRAAVIAAGLALAFSVKITALFAAAGLCAHLALCGRFGELWRVGVSYALFVGGLVAAHAAVGGELFAQQAFFFGFFRLGAGDVASQALWLLAHGDHVLVFAGVGLAVAAFPRWRTLAGAAACVFLSDVVYLVVVSPTLWDHNMIQLVAAGSLLAAAGAREIGQGRLGTTIGAVLAAALVVGGVAVAPPLAKDAYGEPGPGFGGTPREVLARRALFLERHSAAGSVVVISDPWPAFLAERHCFVRYWDLQPVMLGLRASVAADGYAATFDKRDTHLLFGAGSPPAPARVDQLEPYAGRVLANAIVHVRPLLLDALAKREIALVLEPFAPIVLTPSDLEAAGYERFKDLGFQGWRPADGEVRTNLRSAYESR